MTVLGYLVCAFAGWMVGIATVPICMAIYIGLDWRKQDKEYERGTHKGPIL